MMHDFYRTLKYYYTDTQLQLALGIVCMYYVLKSPTMSFFIEVIVCWMRIISYNIL